MKPIEVFLVDDSHAVRSSLTALICHEPDLSVCGGAGSGREALKKIAALKPDVVIVDLSLEDVDGMDLVKKIASNGYGKPAVLVVSMHEEGVYGTAALGAGAKGYLMKARAAEKIVEAVRTVADGGIFVRNCSEVFGQSNGSKQRKAFEGRKNKKSA